MSLHENIVLVGGIVRTSNYDLYAIGVDHAQNQLTYLAAFGRRDHRRGERFLRPSREHKFIQSLMTSAAEAYFPLFQKELMVIKSFSAQFAHPETDVTCFRNEDETHWLQTTDFPGHEYRFTQRLRQLAQEQTDRERKALEDISR